MSDNDEVLSNFTGITLDYLDFNLDKNIKNDWVYSLKTQFSRYVNGKIVNVTMPYYKYPQWYFKPAN